MADGVDEPSEHEPTCPFCTGNEAQTPPEAFAVAGPGREPDRTGWRVRVVPNLFPAITGELGRQEVVVHAPRHVTSLADLSDTEIGDVADAWQARARTALSEGFRYVHAMVNEGRVAGSSLPHGHSQLVWLPGLPPAVEIELDTESCRLCALLAGERKSGERVIAEDDGVVALCPPASRVPYEALVAPVGCEKDGFASDLLAAALARCADVARRLHRIEGRAPLNLWLHTSPLGGGGLHWHLELVPRLTVLAGLELGAGLYVNTLAPESAAAALRAAL